MKAIVFFSNGLGNFLMMMPAIQAVASMTDNNKVDICLDDRWHDVRRPAVEEICQSWSIIDRTINWPKQQIHDYDLWYYSLHSCYSDVQALFLQKIKKSIMRPNWLRSKMHEADHYMEIAKLS